MRNDDSRITSITKALIVGTIWVNLPVFPMMFLVGFLSSLVMTHILSIGTNTPASLLILPIGFAGGWLWWSVNVPKWRLWAYERVDDIPTLKRRAVAVGLIWPDGHFFERTEIKSKEHRQREIDLERRKGDQS